MILVLGPIWVLGGQNCQKYSNFLGPFSYRARVIKESWMAASRTEVLLLSLFIESPNFQDVTVFILAVWKYQYNKINSMFLFRVRLLDEGGVSKWVIYFWNTSFRSVSLSILYNLLKSFYFIFALRPIWRLGVSSQTFAGTYDLSGA